MKMLFLIFILVIMSVLLGLFFSKKTKDNEVMKKINESMKSPNSKGIRIIVAISCLTIVIVIISIFVVNSSNSLVGKTYQMTNTDDLSSLYFKSDEIVVVEYVNVSNYKSAKRNLNYYFKNDTLTIITEDNKKMMYDYDKQSDCFIYSTNIKYCN